MSTAGVALSVKAMVLGLEGSGKTTLVQQLKSMGTAFDGKPTATDGSTEKKKRGGGDTQGAVAEQTISEADTLELAPTTGQEVEIITVPQPKLQSTGSSSSAIGPIREDADQPGAVPSSSPPHGSDGRSGFESGEGAGVGSGGSAPASSSQQFRHVQLREYGGRMVSVWPKFVEKIHKETDVPKALLFVVDVSAPQQLPMALIEFVELTIREDISQWAAIALILNKTTSPSCVSASTVFELMGLFDTQPLPGLTGSMAERGLIDPLPSNAWKIGPNVVAMAVDTWSGHGLLMVQEWLSRLAYGPM